MTVPMQPVSDPVLSRRLFLTRSASAAGGLVLSLHVTSCIDAQEVPSAKTRIYPPDAFVRIQADGKIVIQVNRLEFGQGVATALPLLLADEMDADWSQVSSELAPAEDVYEDPLYHMQVVGGSGSIAHSFLQYRELGARARVMLIAAASERWNVPAEQCRAEASVVHGPSDHSASYAELAADAARMAIPEMVKLKADGEFRLIGKSAKRLDSRAKCDGTQKFGIDVDLPGMKVAVAAHPPVFGAKPKSVDDRSARALSGVVDVFEIPTSRGGKAVAVVAERFWTAKHARDLLKIDWDVSGVELPDSSGLWVKYKELARTPGMPAVQRGDASVIDRIGASHKIVAEYEFPYLAHSPMEPLNTTIRFDGATAEVWAGSQFQTVDQAAIVAVLGLKAPDVKFHTEMAGGGFGRRAVPDSHVQREAAEIAKRLKGIPVKLIWTREDDVPGGYYRPMHAHRVEVGIGPDGTPAAWRHVVVGQSINTGTFVAPLTVKNGVDETAVEGTADTQYQIPNFNISVHHPTVNVPVLWWRSVGHTHNAFVMETLIDELASRVKTDPIEYRRKLLNPGAKRLRSVLDLMAEKSAWRSSLPKGHAVGIACHQCFGTAVACAVDVSLVNGKPKIHRATVAVHCGQAVNPLTVEAQFQAGVAFGVSQLVPSGEITLKEGRVEQRNFDRYQPPYIAETPVTVDVHIVASSEQPTGCGEPPVPVISPAVVNALARLTGKRYRRLPLTTI
jgi:isoquinoline 1-oxidoreductase beta subunit